MALEQPIRMYQGETRTLAVTFTKASDSSRLNLDTEVSAIEFQIKAADGNADPPLLAKSIGSGITKRTQSGDDLGVADITIDSVDTQAGTGNWPASPNDLGVFRYDVVVVLLTGARHYAVIPSDFEVRAVVNQP